MVQGQGIKIYVKKRTVLCEKLSLLTIDTQFISGFHDESARDHHTDDLLKFKSKNGIFA